MLVELAVRDLGVIAELRLVLGPGTTAVTGETGAGKTMVVDAIELLVGGRADPTLVRSGAEEAWVEGRFARGGSTHDAPDAPDEVVIARAIPRSGRSRAYVDGRLATAGELAALGARLVDLHGQHAHQSLLHPGAQREALDRFAGVDLAPLRAARVAVQDLQGELARLGGDAHSRAREIDLLRYQVEEIDGAAITGPDEDRQLEAEEDVLSDAAAHREAAAVALAALSGEGDGAAFDGPASASDAVGLAVAAVAGRPPYAALEGRLRAMAAELSDAAAELRATGEAIDEDPERLEVVRQRRQLLHDLRRKYGDALADVITEGERLHARLAELEGYDERAARLDADLAAAREAEATAAAEVAARRRAAAPELGARIQANLAELAMPAAVVEVVVEGDGPGDDVDVRLAANPGTPPLPLAKVASGGELARTMLALRLVLTDAPPTLVFDEVDAGIGGAAAVAVGRALARLGREHQVLVVTHLPQVAAFADAQVRVAKTSDEASTVSSAAVLPPEERVVELSRMLSGRPDSDSARTHAAELLATAAGERGR
ncbi:MAG TPA: DNA repair protein RecN [Acidimicrobiales bacterium]|nr:DNA repair protein RecN [Acidimicrobiales bacterium]